MSNSMRETVPTTKELLEEYYRGVSKKSGWGHLLSEDFLLTGTVTQETRGRDVYVNNNFFKLGRGLNVRELMVSGEKAFALVSYDLVSPKGRSFSTEVVQFLISKDGDLFSLPTFLDRRSSGAAIP